MIMQSMAIISPGQVFAFPLLTHDHHRQQPQQHQALHFLQDFKFNLSPTATSGSFDWKMGRPFHWNQFLSLSQSCIALNEAGATYVCFPKQLFIELVPLVRPAHVCATLASTTEEDARNRNQGSAFDRKGKTVLQTFFHACHHLNQNYFLC